MVTEQITKSTSFQTLIDRLEAKGEVVTASGLWGSSAPMVAGLASQSFPRALLYVSAHMEDADHARDDLELFLGRTPEVLAAYETVLGEGAASEELAAERARLCGLLADRTGSESDTNNPPIVVAPIQALMQPVPAPSTLETNSFLLFVGAPRDPTALADGLVERGWF